jgi:hypothetical protein
MKSPEQQQPGGGKLPKIKINPNTPEGLAALANLKAELEAKVAVAGSADAGKADEVIIGEGAAGETGEDLNRTDVVMREAPKGGGKGSGEDSFITEEDLKSWSGKLPGRSGEWGVVWVKDEDNKNLLPGKSGYYNIYNKKHHTDTEVISPKYLKELIEQQKKSEEGGDDEIILGGGVKEIPKTPKTIGAKEAGKPGKPGKSPAGLTTEEILKKQLGEKIENLKKIDSESGWKTGLITTGKKKEIMAEIKKIEEILAGRSKGSPAGLTPEGEAEIEEALPKRLGEPSKPTSMGGVLVEEEMAKELARLEALKAGRLGKQEGHKKVEKRETGPFRKFTADEKRDVFGMMHGKKIYDEMPKGMSDEERKSYKETLKEFKKFEASENVHRGAVKFFDARADVLKYSRQLAVEKSKSKKSGKLRDVEINHIELYLENARETYKDKLEIYKRELVVGKYLIKKHEFPGRFLNSESKKNELAGVAVSLMPAVAKFVDEKMENLLRAEMEKTREHGFVGKLWEKYKNTSRFNKILISAGLAAGIGAGVAFGAGLGLAAVTGVAGARAARTLGGGALGAGLNMIGQKLFGIDVVGEQGQLLDKSSEELKKDFLAKIEEQRKVPKEDKGKMALYGLLDEHATKYFGGLKGIDARDAGRRRLIMMVSGVAGGLTAAGFDQYLHSRIAEAALEAKMAAANAAHDVNVKKLAALAAMGHETGGAPATMGNETDLGIKFPAAMGHGPDLGIRLPDAAQTDIPMSGDEFGNKFPATDIADDKAAYTKALHDYAATTDPDIKRQIAEVMGKTTEQLDAETAAATTAGAESAVDYTATVKSGDSIWKLAKNQLIGHYGGDFNDLPKAQQTHLIDAIKDKIAENPAKFGLTDPDKLIVGQKIDFSDIFEDQKLMEGAFGKAAALTDAQMAHILENNEQIATWHEAHPHEALTGDKVAEILGEKPSIEVGEGGASAGVDYPPSSPDASVGERVPSLDNSEEIRDIYDEAQTKHFAELAKKFGLSTLENMDKLDTLGRLADGNANFYELPENIQHDTLAVVGDKIREIYGEVGGGSWFGRLFGGGENSYREAWEMIKNKSAETVIGSSGTTDAVFGEAVNDLDITELGNRSELKNYLGSLRDITPPVSGESVENYMKRAGAFKALLGDLSRGGGAALPLPKN